MKKLANFLFNTTFGKLVLINVMFIAGLLAATGIAIGAAIWFAMFASIGYLNTLTDSKVPSTTKSSGQVLNLLNSSEKDGSKDQKLEDCE